MQLVWPSREYLAEYVAALERGWSPDNLRPEAAGEELTEIERDAAGYLARQIDREGNGPLVILPDGSSVKRLPGYRRWMWDGEFCGSIGFRWQPDTNELPPHVLGHIGYAVVPWKQQRGYATRALALLLPEARKERLVHVDLTTDLDNIPSQKVISANGGVLVERFNSGPIYGDKDHLRWRISL